MGLKVTKKCQNVLFQISTVGKLWSEVEQWTLKVKSATTYMWPNSATRFDKKFPKLPKPPKISKVAKSFQSGKKSPKWQKVANAIGHLTRQGYLAPCSNGPCVVTSNKYNNLENVQKPFAKSYTWLEIFAFWQDSAPMRASNE